MKEHYIEISLPINKLRTEQSFTYYQARQVLVDIKNQQIESDKQHAYDCGCVQCYQKWHQTVNWWYTDKQGLLPGELPPSPQRILDESG